jgi:hypothetical protein
MKIKDGRVEMTNREHKKIGKPSVVFLGDISLCAFEGRTRGVIDYLVDIRRQKVYPIDLIA